MIASPIHVYNEYSTHGYVTDMCSQDYRPVVSGGDSIMSTLIAHDGSFMFEYLNKQCKF